MNQAISRKANMSQWCGRWGAIINFCRASNFLTFGTIAIPLLLVLGCIPIGPATVRVQGTVLDSTSQLPLPFATVSVRLINVEGDLGSGEGTVSDGQFVVDISVPAESGRTAEIEITVVEDECEERYLLNFEDDILVDARLGTLVFEVKDPILVPPCEQSP